MSTGGGGPTGEELDPYAPPRAAFSTQGIRPDGDQAPVTKAVFRLRPEDVSAVRSAMYSRAWLIVLMVVAMSAISLSVLSFVLAVRRLGFTLEAIKAGGPLPWILVIGPAAYLWVRWRRGGESPHEVTVELSPEGFKVQEGMLAESSLSWKTVGEIRETRDHILFLIQAIHSGRRRPVTTNLYPIPRRAFGTPEACQSFLHTARTWRDEAPKDEEPADA
jgi:hypothetical protein